MSKPTDLTGLTAVEMAEKLAAGEITSVELTQAHLDRIQRLNPALNAFLLVDAEGALATAANVDEARAAGEALPRLAGVPVAVKDIACTQPTPPPRSRPDRRGVHGPSSPQTHHRRAGTNPRSPPPASTASRHTPPDPSLLLRLCAAAPLHPDAALL